MTPYLKKILLCFCFGFLQIAYGQNDTIRFRDVFPLGPAKNYATKNIALGTFDCDRPLDLKYSGWTSCVRMISTLDPSLNIKKLREDLAFAEKKIGPTPEALAHYFNDLNTSLKLENREFDGPKDALLNLLNSLSQNRPAVVLINGFSTLTEYLTAIGYELEFNSLGALSLDNSIIYFEDFIGCEVMISLTTLLKNWSLEGLPPMKMSVEMFLDTEMNPLKRLPAYCLIQAQIL